MLKCGRCDADITEGAQCNVCQHHYDFACAGISESNYRKLGKNKSAWRCPECKGATSSPRPGTHHAQGTLHEELQKITSKLSVLDTLSEDMKVIKSDIQHLKSSLELAHDFIKGFTEKISKLEANVKNMETQVAEIPTLRSEVAKIQESMHQQEQWLRSNNIEIKGIPLKQNENLYNILENVGKAVDYPIQKGDINFLTRVPTRQKDAVKPIVISFLYKYQKEDFMVAARKQKQLTVRNIGYEGSGRVFINDHLTPYYKNLLLKAKELKKQTDFQFIWVKNSKILARKSPSTPIFNINCEADLLRIK